MPHILHLAPAGKGKTERLLQILRALTQSKRSALPTVWVLTATRRQALSFRQQLLELDEQVPVYFNIEFFNFYSLNARLLKSASAPVRRLNNLTRYRLLRRLLAQLLEANQLRYFHRIAETRGFASIMAGLIDELKQARVDEDDFAAVAQTVKDWEIALIYRRYQDLLRSSNLADVEGEGWLALAKVKARRDIAKDVDLLLVDGYDQFTLVQAQLLAALSLTIQDVHITLTDIPDVHADALPHRSLQARERLQYAFAESSLDLAQEYVESKSDERQPDLQALTQNIFGDGQFQKRVNSIQLIEMPSPSEEVKRVLRKIKRQLLDGVPPDDILVALRDWNRYAAHFEAGRDAYNLPLLLHYERGLHTTPSIAVLIDLLSMAPRFRRRDLLDVLRSPYIDAGLDADLIDLLDRISMDRQFLGGEAADWLNIITEASQPEHREGEDAQTTVRAAERREALRSRLSAFFGAVTPPARADVASYVIWLESLLGADPITDLTDQQCQESAGPSLNMLDETRHHDDENAEIIRRDIAALHGLKHILRDLSASDDALSLTVGGASEVDWRQFWSDLKHALETTAADPFDRSRLGQVLVTTATEARGLPHRHVYILGLAEGLFPAEIPEDPLYLDSEREGMQARGIPLATQAERIDDQGLFYELVSLPQESLTLSRPTFQAGKVWLESHLWRAVRRVSPQLEPETGTIASVVEAEQSASITETLLGVAARLNGTDPKVARSALRIKNWLQLDTSYATQWRRIDAGRRIELGRLSASPFDRYSGVLSHPFLLGEIARRLGHDHVWSASQLKDYGLCGFRYFAKRLLNLEELMEPQLGIDDLQLGRLCHSILEATYRRIRTENLDIHERNVEAALSIYEEQATALLQDAPQLFGFHASATWEEEAKLLRRRLAAVIEQDFSPASPLSRFGETRRVRMLERYFEEAQIEMPGDMPALRVSGLIDRIDWGAEDELILVDYKTGSHAIGRRQMEIGRDLQMFIYVLAMDWAERQIPGEPRLAGGLFWHLRSLRASGVFSVDNKDDQAALEMARMKLADNLRQGRHGQFPVRATELEEGKCARYCEYSRLCRMRVTNSYKTLPPL